MGNFDFVSLKSGTSSSVGGLAPEEIPNRLPIFPVLLEIVVAGSGDGHPLLRTTPSVEQVLRTLDGNHFIVRGDDHSQRRGHCWGERGRIVQITEYQANRQERIEILRDLGDAIA